MAESSLGEVRESLHLVFGNRDLRRVQLAFAGSILGDWAYATAATVWAYSVGGATAVGLFSAVRFISVAVAGPLGAAVADKVPRRTFMLATDAIRAVLVALAAIAITVEVPALLVFALVLACGMVGAPFRSAQAGLIPRLVTRPEELTASNAVAANLENVVVFVGPAIGGAMVALVDVQAAFWFNVLSYVWSFAMVNGVRVPAESPASAPDGSTSDDGGAEPGFLAEVSAGFAVLGRDGDLRAMALLAGSQGFVWGALGVFMVTISIETLHAGPAGIGYLNALMGAGTVLGGLVVLARTRKGRLSQDMVVGVLGWALPLVALAAFPHPVTAVLALAVIGTFDPWVNLGFETIPQRIAPDRVLSRVYAAAESALIAAMSLGAFAAPLLLHLVGFRPALVVVGLLVTGVALTSVPRMRGLDARLAAPVHLELLQSLALFSPLSAPTQETIARRLESVTLPAGTAVVTEGGSSDRFYVIASGRVEVTQGERVLRHEGPGEFFGEIGLLRDVPRTATVTCTEDTELLALDRADFLRAVTGQDEARGAAEDIVSRRLAV